MSTLHTASGRQSATTHGAAADRGVLSSRPRHFFSIRLIVTAVAVALVAGGVLGVGWVGERQMRGALTAEIESRLLLTGRNLARLSAGALLSEFPELVLHPSVREIQEDHEELAFVVVVDHEKRIQGHADVRSLEKPFALPADLMDEPVRLRLQAGEEVRGNENTLVISTPVRHPNGAAIGMVHVGLRRSHLESAATAARQKQGMVLMLLLLLSVASTLILMTVLLRPIDRLRSGLERIGRGNLNDPIELRDRTEFQLLAESINSMASELRQAQEQMMEKERLKHEMELARQIQGSLLPAHSVIAGDFEILGVNQAAAEVGGDYFDVLELPDGRVGIAIADVSGKGLAGCLVMSMVAVLLRSLRRSHRTPSALLGTLDEQLAGNLRPGVFVTMFYGILDPRTGHLCYASAGHSPVLLFRAATGQVEWHYTEAIPIGAVKGALRETLRDYELELAAGDTLVQFTDGVNEAWEPRDREQFGFERLEQVVRQAAPGGSRAVVTAVRRALTQWTGDLPRMDDETLVVMHRLPTGAASPSKDLESSRTALLPGAAEVLAERAWSLRDSGSFLQLRVDPAELRQLRSWLQSCPQLASLPHAEAVLLEHGLHELCANIIEHGYGDQDASEVNRHGVDLWWIPDANLWNDESLRDPARFDADVALQHILRRGIFLVRDRGQAFSPSSQHLANLEDLAVRKRGRGLGLRIIQEIMQPLLYLGGVAQGNLTLMRFDPVRSGSLKEVRHVSSRQSAR